MPKAWNLGGRIRSSPKFDSFIVTFGGGWEGAKDYFLIFYDVNAITAKSVRSRKKLKVFALFALFVLFALEI